MTTLDLELDDPRAPTVGAPLRGRVHIRGEVPRGGVVRVAAVVTLKDLRSPQGLACGHQECETTVDVSGPDVAFALPPLCGPPSYRGQRVELSWTIVAMLRENAAIVARAEMPIAVGEGGVESEPNEALDYRGHVLPRDAYQPSFGEAHREGLANPQLARAPGVVPMGGALGWIVRALFSHPLTMELSVNPTRVRRGEEVEVAVTLDVREPTVIEGIAAWMVEYEGRRGQVATYARELEDQPSRHKLCERAHLERGAHRYTTRIAVPSGAAPSYSAGVLCIAWVVRVAVQLDGKPELVHNWHLAVH